MGLLTTSFRLSSNYKCNIFLKVAREPVLFWTAGSLDHSAHWACDSLRGLNLVACVSNAIQHIFDLHESGTVALMAFGPCNSAYLQSSVNQFGK